MLPVECDSVLSEVHLQRNNVLCKAKHMRRNLTSNNAYSLHCS